MSFKENNENGLVYMSSDLIGARHAFTTRYRMGNTWKITMNSTMAHMGLAAVVSATGLPADSPSMDRMKLTSFLLPLVPGILSRRISAL